jgi:hypothetical protein
VTGPGRNWDKELAEIDKLMTSAPARPPALPGGGAAPAQRPAAAPAPSRPAVGGPTLLGTWVRILLALVLAGAMTQWPYQRACGVSLMFYLGATGVTIVAGLWAAGATWKRRMGVLHGLALLTTLWGIGLAAAVVLPRTGYAKQAATWWCQ